MPTLNWIGKNKIVNLDKEIPFCILDKKYEFGRMGCQYDADKWVYGNDVDVSDNLIIHGDNLYALKSLMATYEKRINVVYIDPPYNTGEEGWIYNDNVKDPALLKWLGEVVGKEKDDLSRHDKWLCMMYPRLSILKKLLSTDGIICVSIDDNELFRCGMLMDEIFGPSNRLACAPWLAEPSGGKEKTKIRNGHEYLLIYTNGSIESHSRDERSEGKLNLKDQWGKYRKGRELRKWGGNSQREDRPNQWFGITAPDGEVVFPFKNDGTEGHWRWSTKNSEMQKILENPDYAHWEKCPYDPGVSVNGQTERWVPFEKIRNEKKTVGWTSWLDKIGYNSDATAELKQIFGKKEFDTPKPTSLVSWIISLYDSQDCIVLDSFAGSGTTAHAVLKLNSEDGGKRRFILIETLDYAESITAERVKRVISGYADQQGISDSFSYYDLGQPLFDSDGHINKEVNSSTIRNYIWYMETRTPLEKKEFDKPYYLGKEFGTSYWFYYEKDRKTVLDMPFFESIDDDSDSYVIYADACTLPRSYMFEHNINFKKIPREIPRF